MTLSKLITLSIFTISLVALQSCHTHNLFDCVEGEGSVTSQTFDLNEFAGVNLMIDARVHITQGNTQTVVVEAQENVLDEMILDVRKGILSIDYDNCVRDERRVDIFITMDNIELLKIQGSGSMFGENTFDCKDLNLIITGSGDMDLDVEAELLEGKISGSGDIKLSGEAEEMVYKITGSGDLEAFRFIVEEAFVKISGSGDMEVHVEEELEVNISGSGDVKFKGHPKLDIHITGSGDVVDVN